MVGKHFLPARYLAKPSEVIQTFKLPTASNLVVYPRTICFTKDASVPTMAETWPVPLCPRLFPPSKRNTRVKLKQALDEKSHMGDHLLVPIHFKKCYPKVRNVMLVELLSCKRY